MKRARRERGNAYVTTLLLMVLLGFAALALSVGRLTLAHTQTEAAVEAASLAGVAYLDRTAEGVALAKQKALAIGTMHTVLYQPADITPDDVEVGILTDGVFQAVTDLSAVDLDAVNAVRVTETSLLDTTVLPRAVFGVAQLSTRAAATAVRPSGRAGSSECFLPLAVPDCHWDEFGNRGVNPPPIRFEFSSSHGDDLAWGFPFRSPDANTLRNQLGSQCTQGTVAVGDSMNVDEGQKNAAVLEIAAILNERSDTPPTYWPEVDMGRPPVRDGLTANVPLDSRIAAPRWGNLIEGPVALVDAGPNCDDLSFTGALKITGFVWGMIYDAGVRAENIWVQLDYVGDHIIEGEIDPDAKGSLTADGTPILTL